MGFGGWSDNVGYKGRHKKTNSMMDPWNRNIETMKAEVEKLVGTNAFFADFMLVDLKKLQAKTEASQLEANCIHMIAVMEASGRRLMKHANALLHMKLAKDTALASNESLVPGSSGKAKRKTTAKAGAKSAA